MYKWCLHHFLATHNRQHIITHLPGLKRIARTLNSLISELDFWSMLLYDDITEIVVKNTNIKITDLNMLYASNPSYVNYIDNV